MKPAFLSKTIELVSALFILVFVYTATSKLLHHESFVFTLKKSPVTDFAGTFLSWAIPAIELLISLMLFVPRLRELGLYAAFGLMILFTSYIVYMLIFSSRLPCSCGGVINKLSWNQHLWLNVFLTMMAAAAILINRQIKFLLQ